MVLFGHGVDQRSATTVGRHLSERVNLEVFVAALGGQFDLRLERGAAFLG